MTPNHSGNTPEPTKRADARPSVHNANEVRGFALYVGLSEQRTADDGTSLVQLVNELKAVLATHAPSAETHATVALAPRDGGGRDIDVVRLALGEPAAVAQHERSKRDNADEPEHRGVIIDLSRKRVVIDGEHAPLTYKEFELLQFFVLREGLTVDRAALVAGLWAEVDESEVPNARTIDVHVRRLRMKLNGYEDIVRTVRGSGYRFDRHADVQILHTATPSPDIF